MRAGLKNPTIWGLGTLLAASSALALSQSFDATLAGWAPLVRMWGQGDPTAAVSSLEQVTSAYEIVLHKTEIDAPTQKFIDRSLDELEDFDLDGFHDLLPEQKDGYRQLWVRGDLLGARYSVRKADAKSAFLVGVHGPRKKLADLSAVLRAKPHKGYGDHKSFMLGGRIGIGVGALSWEGLTGAVTDGLRLASTGDPREGSAAPPVVSEATKKKVKELNPGLGDEDVEVLGLLYEAFPSLSQTLSQVGRVEDVRVAAPGASYHHITARTRIVPERLKQKYPALAKHLGKLGELASAEIRWLDGQGRQVLKAKLDTKNLGLGLECFVKDGKILPFKRDHVFDDQPIDPMGDALKTSRMVVDAKLKMLGIVIKLDNLKTELRYDNHKSYAEMSARVNSVPGIRVQGAALGFLPTGFVDAFIPGNMESLTRDFFEVAVHGNDNQGVLAGVNLGTEQAGAPGALEAAFDVEALDNFLVKMGVGIVNDRVIPSDSAIADGKKLAAQLHDAFIRDLSRFESRVKNPG